ncbi:hypothetical protein DPEC_G00160070 [Dallia pectoralis]|uniref:Uncharacterized protein n=1 Tax=Dallia pectoralis TaxID=75939 RepID=A0ACC2GG82_DALPE|nr:hypothetical protein DPEC_G00160070 [Dallia pectoralis]
MEDRITSPPRTRSTNGVNVVMLRHAVAKPIITTLEFTQNAPHGTLATYSFSHEENNPCPVDFLVTMLSLFGIVTRVGSPNVGTRGKKDLLSQAEEESDPLQQVQTKETRGNIVELIMDIDRGPKFNSPSLRPARQVNSGENIQSVSLSRVCSTTRASDHPAWLDVFNSSIIQFLDKLSDSQWKPQWKPELESSVDTLDTVRPAIYI